MLLSLSISKCREYYEWNDRCDLIRIGCSLGVVRAVSVMSVASVISVVLVLIVGVL